jgi:hypothetical protein
LDHSESAHSETNTAHKLPILHVSNNISNVLCKQDTRFRRVLLGIKKYPVPTTTATGVYCVPMVGESSSRPRETGRSLAGRATAIGILCFVSKELCHNTWLEMSET